MKNNKTEVVKILNKVIENKMEGYSRLITVCRTFNLQSKSLQTLLKNFPKTFQLKITMRIKKRLTKEEG